jgi:hypothetical protein
METELKSGMYASGEGGNKAACGCSPGGELADALLKSREAALMRKNTDPQGYRPENIRARLAMAALGRATRSRIAAHLP